MHNISSRIDELYESFKGFPSKFSIVRNNQVNDALSLVVFEILFQNYHGIKKLNYDNEEHRELITRVVVPPPDDSIDLFFEEENLDEYKYHVVQVKNSDLSAKEIEACFLLMENTIKAYIKKPKDIARNLKEIIGDTDFGNQSKSPIIYYVVHKGSTKFIRNQKDNYVIVTLEELSLLEKGTQQMCVPLEKFEVDTANNFIVNNFIENKVADQNNKLPRSILCNFSGYDLAKLNNKYSNTLVGRNVLYGQNLREGLNKASKTFFKMFDTINNEPELFLFYNNGITIISSDFDAKTESSKEKITVNNFSIINGAQTTSTLGAFLKEAELNNETEKIEKLKKVFVLTKIYEINKKLINHDMISENIKIFSNTQTPLSSRDMVSIRKEQINLQKRLLEGEIPNIFVNIKKGVEIPSFPKTFPHQRISNETLAQLALCGFYREPFTAKDRKNKIFDNDSKDEYNLNFVYHKLFDENDGILFQKNKIEINELLFVYRLHEDTKKFLKNNFKEQINHYNQTPLKVGQNKEHMINRCKRNLEISNVCLFFNIALYYSIKNNFDDFIKDADKLQFNYKKYYENKSFRDSLINEFSKLFFNRTLTLITKNSGIDNVNNWLRSEKNEKIFLDSLDDDIINEGYDIQQKYLTFIQNYKL